MKRVYPKDQSQLPFMVAESEEDNFILETIVKFTGLGVDLRERDQDTLDLLSCVNMLMRRVTTEERLAETVGLEPTTPEGATD